MTSSDAWDVVVLGSGIAGLAGALAADQLGLRPIVLEKARTLGGGTVNSYVTHWATHRHGDFTAYQEGAHAILEALRRGRTRPVSRIRRTRA